GILDEPAWKEASAEKVTLADALRKEEPYGQYFKEQVRLELLERFGHDRLYEGGLRVYTTINLDMQKAAESEVEKSLKVIEARRRSGRKPDVRKASAPSPPIDDEVLQASLVALDVDTGAVRALVGGRDFGATKFNRVVQARRQPGSAFKPFIYAAALDAGYTPASLIERLDEPIETLQGDWVPEDGHSTEPALTMRTALKISSNRAAVRMLEEVGIQNAVTYAERMGVGLMPSVPSLALGSGEVTLQTMTAAYGIFASGGVRREPFLIRRVEDPDGTVLYQAATNEVRVISPQSAFLMTSMLSDVINNGTAWKARQLGFKLPAAGKTGTTNDYHDAWFVGYTPTLVTGVWVGFDQPQTILPGGYAADLAVPLWATFMRSATHRDKPEAFPVPTGLTTVQVCRLSGKRPADGCGHVLVENDDGSSDVRSVIYNEYFVRGTEPKDTCPFHVGRSIFGRVAGWMGSAPTVAASSSSADSPTAPVDTVSDENEREPDAQAEKAEPEKKKRGFWGRVFGGRDKNERKPPK
ncbi:MAG: hypothetical protein LC791_06340, partial [Acidobacteria bacterium]|nr:hypothetical protein [Acidobacteriota bacterium]